MSAKSPQPNEKSYRNPDELERLYREEGMTQEEIAEKFGLSTPGINYWIQKFGITTPEPKESSLKETVPHRESGKSNIGKTYRQWTHFYDGELSTVYFHRLQAVVDCYPVDMPISEILEDMDGKHSHHESGHGLDNRPDNIEMLTPREHKLRHNGNNDKRILSFLKDREYARSVEIQQHLDRSKPQTNKALNHLRDEGLVERFRCPEDRRKVVYRLTERP